MSFPLFLRGMLFALAAFAVTTYFVTQSAWLTLVYTLVCAAIIQFGYFVAILAMVWAAPRKPGSENASYNAQKDLASQGSGDAVGEAEHVSSKTRSQQL